MKEKIQKIANRIDKSNKSFWTTYIVLSAFFFLCFWFGFLIHGKGFIWSVDGLEQQYMFFILQGEWFRDLLSNVFVAHTFEIPMWTPDVGYGADYFISISNTFGNPINWISVFATAETADYFLNATVPLTLFLAGIAFLKFCLYEGFDRQSSIIGCMIYLFGGFSFIAFSQIYMIYVLILAPLTIYGVEKVFNNEAPFLFIVAMFLNFFYSVDQAYVACLLLLLYCGLRVFLMPEKTTVKSFFLWFIKVFGCIVVGALLAAITFYPAAVSLVTQDRLGLDRYESLTYSLQYYLRLFEGFINCETVGEDCLFGFAPIALLSVFALFLNKPQKDESARTKRLLKILFIVLTVFLCLPLFGKLFNGFAYPNNRWVWAYCFLVSMIVVIGLPHLRTALVNDDKKILGAVAVYALISVTLLLWYSGKYFYAALALLFATATIVFALCKTKAVFNAALIVTVAIGCYFVSYQMGGSSEKTQIKPGGSYSASVIEDASYVLNDVSDASESRYDQAESRKWRNGNLANGMLGSTFYNSFYNSYVDEYHTSLGLDTSSMNFSWATFDSRTTMEALAGVKYFIVPTSDTSQLPPLYSTKIAERKVGKTSYSAYEADTVLPLAFVYDEAITRDEYDSFDMAMRQDVLTQAVVLEDLDDNTKDEARKDAAKSDSENSDISASDEIKSHSVSLQYSLDLSSKADDDKLPLTDSQSNDFKNEHVRVEGNTFTIYEPNTVLYLHADIPSGTEAYFSCTGMEYEPFTSYEAMTDSEKSSLNFLAKAYSEFDSFVSEDAKDCKIMVYGESSEQEIWYMNNKHHLYGGKHDWVANVGYSDKSRNVIALKFVNPGVYSFDSLNVFAQYTDEVENDIAALAAHAALNIKEEGNSLCCSVDSEGGQYLYFRIPYSEGWTAEVDGQKVDILKANLGFMALPMESGYHDVVLTYETPHLAMGALLSLIGVVALIGCIIVYRRKKHRG